MLGPGEAQERVVSRLRWPKLLVEHSDVSGSQAGNVNGGTFREVARVRTVGNEACGPFLEVIQTGVAVTTILHSAGRRGHQQTLGPWPPVFCFSCISLELKHYLAFHPTQVQLGIPWLEQTSRNRNQDC